MKNRLNPFLGTFASIAFSLGLIQSSSAAALKWDVTSGDGATITAGSGTWNTIATDLLSENTVWNNAGANPNIIWSQTNATTPTNSATFAGSDGAWAITVGEALASQSLTFSNDGYTLSAASPVTITNNGTISVASTKSATIGANVKVTKSGGVAITGGGTLNITGTGATVSYTGANTSSITGGTTVNVGTGGTLTNSTSIIVGDTSGGALNVNGGTVSVTGNNGNFILNNSASGTVAVTLTTGAITNTQTSGTIRFGGSGGTSTFHLDGGILTGGRVYENSAAVSSTFNFNGGTLKVLSGSVNLANFMSVDTANVRNGGAFIDSNGTNVTIAKALTHSNIGGDNPTDGGLTKEGLGTLTLTGANTYTGDTIINGGSLRVVAPGTGTAPITAPTINSGGRLGVTTGASQVSVTGTVTVNTDGGFEANVGTYNASNVSGLSIVTLNAAGNYKVDLTGTSIPICDITVLTYTPANKTGSGTPSVGTLPLGCTATVEDTGSAIILHVLSPSASPFTWSKGDGDWDTSSLNWNSNLAAYAEPALATFPDLADLVDGVNAVNVTAPRSPYTVTINNTGDYDTNAYSFSGAGKITGTTGITKTGVGVVTFSNAANDYTGATTISAGALIKATADTTTGAVSVENGAALGLSGSITTGTGQTLTLSGPGVASDNIIAASTTTQRGSLQSVSGNNTWAGDIVLTGTAGTGGNTRIGTQTGADLTITGNISEGVAGMSPFFRPGDSNTITFSGTGSWTGTTRIFSNGGTFKLGGSDKLPAGSHLVVGYYNGNHSFDLAGFNQTVAGISNATGAVIKNSGGTSTLTLAPTVAANYTGIIQDAVNLIIGGTAVQTLGGANTYTGNTTINTGGSLTLAATTGSLRFKPTTNGVTNSISGTGTATLNGKFVVDLTGSSTTSGNSWTLVDKSTLTATFNDTTFAIETSAAVAFTDPENDGVWTLVDGSNAWNFSEADGKLTVTTAVSGYAAWQLANGAGVQTVDQDHDSDGVDNGIEYFMGGNTVTTGFTTTPGIVSNAITWPMAATYTGTYGTHYVVQTSPDLTTWTPATVGAGPGFVVINPGVSVIYTMPAPAGKLFVRLLVNPN